MSSCQRQEYAQRWENLPSSSELLDVLDESSRDNQFGQHTTSARRRIRSAVSSFSSPSLRAAQSTLPYQMMMRRELRSVLQEDNEDSSSVEPSSSQADDEQSRVSRTLHILNEALEIINAADF